jgi:hypothetical protein
MDQWMSARGWLKWLTLPFFDLSVSVYLASTSMKARLRADPEIRERLRAALERVSLGSEGYVSMTDSISLRNWLCGCYRLPVSAFDDVYLKYLKKLGEEILAGK